MRTSTATGRAGRPGLPPIGETSAWAATTRSAAGRSRLPATGSGDWTSSSRPFHDRCAARSAPWSAEPGVGQRAQRRRLGVHQAAGQRVDADLRRRRRCARSGVSTCSTGLRLARGAPRYMLTSDVGAEDLAQVLLDRAVPVPDTRTRSRSRTARRRWPGPRSARPPSSGRTGRGRRRTRAPPRRRRGGPRGTSSRGRRALGSSRNSLLGGGPPDRPMVSSSGAGHSSRPTSRRWSRRSSVTRDAPGTRSAAGGRRTPRTARVRRPDPACCARAARSTGTRSPAASSARCRRT